MMYSKTDHNSRGITTASTIFLSPAITRPAKPIKRKNMLAIRQGNHSAPMTTTRRINAHAIRHIKSIRWCIECWLNGSSKDKNQAEGNIKKKATG